MGPRRACRDRRGDDRPSPRRRPRTRRAPRHWCSRRSDPTHLVGQRTLTAACIAFGFASGALVIAATAAILNATAEEVIWRWSAVRLLEHNGAPPLVTQLTQAASFAIAHMGGIPRGYTGIAMTFAYALIVLPMARRSLRLAIACHAAADAVFITYLIT